MEIDNKRAIRSLVLYSKNPFCICITFVKTINVHAFVLSLFRFAISRLLKNLKLQWRRICSYAYTSGESRYIASRCIIISWIGQKWLCCVTVCIPSKLVATVIHSLMKMYDMLLRSCPLVFDIFSSIGVFNFFELELSNYHAWRKTTTIKDSCTLTLFTTKPIYR